MRRAQAQDLSDNLLFLPVDYMGQGFSQSSGGLVVEDF